VNGTGDREDPVRGEGLSDAMDPDLQEEPGGAGELDELRHRISQVDDQLIRLLGERRDLVVRIGREKARMGLPVMDPGREAAVVRKVAQHARELNVDEELVRDVIWRIIASARAEQENRPLGWP